jgi:prepilin-type N-terminal cleavage/methylation domain-containing protein
MLMPGLMRRLYARIRGEESGFTLIELMVAITVIVIALVSLAYTANLAFTDAAFARQRQSANGIASRAIEEARALPFDTLKKGLSSNDTTVTSDSALTACSTDKCFQGEPVPLSGYAAGTTISPFVPHTTTKTVGPTTYTLKTYVTYYQGAGAPPYVTPFNKTSNTFRVTAVVTWTARERAGASHSVQVQTVVYSPTGCLSTATHPFAAPCQPFFYATATSDQGHIDITGSIQTVPVFDRASVWLPGDNSNQQIEQTATVQGKAFTGGVSIKYPSVDETFQGHSEITTGADNDPSTPGLEVGPAPPAVVPLMGTQPALTPITNSSLLGALTLTGSAGDTTSTMSTTSGDNAAHACPAPGGGAPQNDLQPCGNAKSLQVGTLTATFQVTAAASDLGPATLVRIQPPAATSPGFAYTNRDIAPEATMCTTTSGDGCTHSEAHRTIGPITLATLPEAVAASAPPGWNQSKGLVQLTDLSDTVVAEAGVGTAAPTRTTTGTISFYNGSGYTTCSLYGAVVGPPALPACAVDASNNLIIPELVLNDPLHPGVTVDIKATLQPASVTNTGPTSTVATCSPACPNTRTDARAGSESPVSGQIHYVVSATGLPQADLTIGIKLGQLLAKASYQAAPSG